MGAASDPSRAPGNRRSRGAGEAEILSDGQKENREAVLVQAAAERAAQKPGQSCASHSKGQRGVCAGCSCSRMSERFSVGGVS